MGGEALWELVKVFLAALFASTLTHLLTHRRFIQGRWWDRKADAYGDIIGALVSVVYFLKASISVGTYAIKGLEGSEISESVLKRRAERVDEVVTEVSKAMDEVRRAVIEGDYVISRRAAGALSEFMERCSSLGFKGIESHPSAWNKASLLRDARELVSALSAWSDATKSCLEIVRAEARSDLRVKWYSL
jgi:hypothetical protein